MSEHCGTMPTGQPIIKLRGRLKTDELVIFEHISFHSSHQCNCLHKELQNRLLEGKVNLPHRSIIITTNAWMHGIILWLGPDRQTSASDVADPQPSGLFFQSSHVHAGQHKNVDNTLLINGASALEKQRKTQLLWNEFRSLYHGSIRDDQTFKVKRQAAKLQMS